MKTTVALLLFATLTTFSFAGPKKDGADKAKKKPDPEKVFAKKDADADGKLSKDEFLKGAKDATRAEKAFGHKDKDKDGFLSKEEFKAQPGKKKKA